MQAIMSAQGESWVAEPKVQREMQFIDKKFSSKHKLEHPDETATKRRKKEESRMEAFKAQKDIFAHCRLLMTFWRIEPA
jgi:hypothetical protein